MTQQQLAERLAVSVGTVHRWEAGRFKPSRMAERSLRDFLARTPLPEVVLARFNRLQSRASTTLSYAVGKTLPRVSTLYRSGYEAIEPQPCVDCGELAAVYDHRDYYKPLEVVPVCQVCNSRRGRAVNTLLHPEFWDLSVEV